MVAFSYSLIPSKYIIFIFLLSLLIDIEFLFPIINFIFLHMLIGLKSIIFDYIHKKKLSFFLGTLINLIVIENLMQTFHFFF